MKKALLNWTLTISMTFIFLTWSCNQEIFSFVCSTNKNIRISLMIGKSSLSKSGCASCFLKNKDQWNFLYRILKENYDIEFVVYCPDKIKNDIERNLLYNTAFITKKIPQDDVLTVCAHSKVVYQKIGILDMSSIRRITDMVVDLGF